MPDPAHLSKLQSGVEIWNQWSREKLEVSPDLSDANLMGADHCWFPAVTGGMQFEKY
jgi:hypothetical protein